MINFYNAADNVLYKQPNSQFITQDRFRGNVAPNPGEIEEEKITETFGIPNTKTFQSMNNNGDNFSGYNFNNSDFQQAVDARQNRLNNPSDTFLGFNTSRDQNLTGADLGEYIGSNTAVPREQTIMGKVQNFLTPQSADQIMAEGYQEPRFQPGIIGTMLGKMDNYRNLPRADQAFIAQNMGYTGPTIFGENTSGLSKDEFGINTRSLFGNYANFVDKAARSDMTEEEYNALKGMEKRRVDAYRAKKIEREEIQAEVLAGQMERDREAGKAGKSDSQDLSRAGSLGRRPGSGGNVTATSANTNKETGTTYDSGGREGYGYGLKDGGRIGYYFGGLAARGMKR